MPEKLKFLVLGDHMTDVWHIGELRKEAAQEDSGCPVFIQESVYYQHGGARNVADNLTALGAAVNFGSLDAEISKHRYITTGNKQLFRVDVEPSPIRNCPPRFYADASVDAVIIADYGKGSIDATVWNRLSEKFGTLPLFVHTKSPASIRWPKIQNVWMHMNIDECLFNHVQYEKLLTSGARALVTKGKYGATIISRNGNPDSQSVGIPQIPGDVVSVVGAGDTAMAAFAYMFMKMRNAEEQNLYPNVDAEESDIAIQAARFAMVAAGIAVRRPMTSVVSLQDIQQHSDLLYSDLL